MRAGWNANLERITRCARPLSSLIVEAVAVEESAIKQTKTAMEAADSLTGFTVNKDGSIRLTPSSTALISSVTGPDGYRTALDQRLGVFDCAKLTLAGTQASETELYSIVAYLNPNTGGGLEVAYWSCHIWAKFPQGGAFFTLIEVCQPVYVAAPLIAGNVTFSYSGRNELPKPLLLASGLTNELYIEIRGMKADGSGAANVGWARDSATASVTTAGITLTGATLTPNEADDASGNPAGFSEADTTQTPRITLNNGTVTTGTLYFTGSSNRLDLAAIPTADIVEFILRAYPPPGSTLTAYTDQAEVAVTSITSVGLVATVTTTAPHSYTSGDEVIVLGANQAEYNEKAALITVTGASTFTYPFAGSGTSPATGTITVARWVSFRDGSMTSDSVNYADASLLLSGLPGLARSTYRLRLKFTADSSGVLTPTLYGVGVHALAIIRLDDQVSIEGGGSRVDPITLKAEIGKATLKFIRDGVTDYRDAISDLLTTYHINDIEFRIWLGHPNPAVLARGDWMLKNTYKINDTAVSGPTVDVTVISPLAELRQVLPVAQFSDETVPISGIARVGTTATVTAGVPLHGIKVGDTVEISGATETAYNGRHKVTAVPTADTFNYEVVGAPATPATGSPVIVKPRQPIAYTYSGLTLKAAVEDIVDVQMRLPSRYRGQLIPDDFGNVLNIIGKSDAKDEADRLHYIVGYALIAAQGKLKSVRMISDPSDVTNGQRLAAIFPMDEIRVGTVGPGLTERIPEQFVRYGCQDFSGTTPDLPPYYGEVRGFNELAVLNLSRNRLGEEPYPPDEGIEKWMPAEVISSLTRVGTTVTATTQSPHSLVSGQTVMIAGPPTLEQEYITPLTDASGFAVTVTGASTFTYVITGAPTTPATTDPTDLPRFSPFAHKIAKRNVEILGPGLFLLPFESIYQHHELEEGDLVAVQTDRIVLKDPITGRAIRGLMWTVGPICLIADESGRHFVQWIQWYGNILGSAEAAKRLGFAVPVVLDCQLFGDEGGDGVVTGLANAADARAVRWATSNADYPDLATTEAGTLVALDAQGHASLGTIDTLANAETAYVSLLAYENADGTGAASTFMFQKRITRRAAETKTIELSHADFTQWVTTGNAVDHLDGYARGATASGAVVACAIILPVGVTITDIEAHGYVLGACAGPTFPTFGFELRRTTGDGVSTLLATAVISDNLGWVDILDQLNELVDVGDSYVAYVTVVPCVTSGADSARFSRMKLTYNSPSYYETT